MRIFLIGVSCVGVTAVGALLAERLGCSFYDHTAEVERHFGKPLTHLRRQALLERIYRRQYAVPVLKKLIDADPGCDVVIGLTPAGLQDVVWNVVKQVERVVVVLRDSPENILKRITFYDDDSKRIEKKLTAYKRTGLPQGNRQGHRLLPAFVQQSEFRGRHPRVGRGADARKSSWRCGTGWRRGNNSQPDGSCRAAYLPPREHRTPVALGGSWR